MQKKIIALAVAALASAGAYAQSNVTVYGIVDAGVANYNIGGKKDQFAVESGMLSGSRLGFKGAEDLGNGLKAIFALEYALAVDDNTGVGALDSGWSSTAARQQLVGLSSAKFGTVALGRLQTAGYDFACAYNPVAGGAFDTIGRLGAATVLSCGSGGRRDNAMAYISPSFAGLTLAVNHARVTESANTNATHKDAYATILHAKYENGPIGAGVIFSKVSGRNADGDNDVTEYGIGASYDFKVVKLFAEYQNQRAGDTNHDSKFALGASVPVMAHGTVLASVGLNKIDSTNTSSSDARAYSLVYNHALSKRTTLYAGYTFVDNQDNSAKALAGSNAYGVPQTGLDGSITAVGMRHAF